MRLMHACSSILLLIQNINTCAIMILFTSFLDLVGVIFAKYMSSMMSIGKNYNFFKLNT